MMKKNFKFEQYIRLLSIAGSDSGGGAGIQADLKTFHRFQCYGMTVVTAITAQNTSGVSAVFDLPAEIVDKQFKAILTDIGTDAIKIGMLYSNDVVEVIAKNIIKYKCKNIILDPVMLSKNNFSLLAENAVQSLVQKLFPLVDVLTPNIPEAEYILGYKINTMKLMEQAGAELLAMGPKAVIIKGGHFSSQNYCADCLVINVKNSIKNIWLESERIHTQNTHGTGCTFSAALAVHLARDNNIEKSFHLAKEYIHYTIKEGSKFQLGQGKGPVFHF